MRCKALTKHNKQCKHRAAINGLCTSHWAKKQYGSIKPNTTRQCKICGHYYKPKIKERYGEKKCPQCGEKYE